MLFIVMCKSVDFRTVSGDGGWQRVEACAGASFTSWHRLSVPDLRAPLSAEFGHCLGKLGLR